ncbi:MAG: hypothetical protein R2867_08225 [Caldilineaceae bacterium]
MAGIVVSLLSSYGYGTNAQITTTATGAFRFTTLFPGIYHLRAADPSGLYATQCFTTTNNGSRATDLVVNGNQISGLTFTLQRSGQISGRVTIGGEVPPLLPNGAGYVAWYAPPAADFALIGSTPFLSTTGQYTIPALLPGVYRICASSYLPSASYIGSCYGGLDLQSAAPVTVSSGITVPAVNIDLEAGQFEGVISGKVTLHSAPVANIRVDLQGYSSFSNILLYTMTNTAGEYAFGGLPAGSYSAIYSDPADRYPSLWHDGFPAGPEAPYFYYRQPLALLAGEVLSNVNVSLVEYGGFQGKVLRQVPPIRAGEQITVVLDAQIAGQTIYIQRYPELDELGNYTVTRLFPGDYRIGFYSCFRYFEGWYCPIRYYGMETNGFGTPVPIASGQILPGINSLIGPDPILYIPFVSAITGTQVLPAE